MDHIKASNLVLFMKEPGTVFSDKELEKIVPFRNQSDKKIIFVINKIDIKKHPLPELSKKYQHLPKI